MRTLFLLLICMTTFIGNAQSKKEKKEKYVSFAFLTAQTAMPFNKFSALFSNPYHPGAEMALGKVLSNKELHQWFAEIKLAYFYHRFVQHVIPLYANIGYRHKVVSHLFANLSLGAGYLHSIPAVSKYKLNNDGDYDNNIGIGRAQATIVFSAGLQYNIVSDKKKPLRVFVNYQQLLQMPFINAYVPLLPYNSLQAGVSWPFKK